VEGNYAYVADLNNGLVIVDVSNPAEPTLKGSYNIASAAQFFHKKWRWRETMHMWRDVPTVL